MSGSPWPPSALVGVGSLLLAGVSPRGGYLHDLLPGLLVFGFGLGGGAVAATVAALSGVRERDAGVASGTNTAAFQIGGALGSAVITSVIVATTGTVGADHLRAMTGGFRAGFVACAVLAALAVLTAAALPRRGGPPEA